MADAFTDRVFFGGALEGGPVDLVLVSITAISLVLAIAMGLIVFKLLREERLRSDARVALLTAAAADDPSPRLREPEPTPHMAVASGDLFVVSEVDSPWLHRLGIAAALALTVAFAAYGVSRLGSPTPTADRAATTQSAPLELLALQHTQEVDALTITGTVLNPPGGAAASQVAVTAFLFGADGSFLASGRASLDYAALAPGDESGFLIKVPVQGTVARYRVGFRGPDGSVIAHVDRRTDGSSARHKGTTGSAPWVR